MPSFELNRDNYSTPEADIAYMSCSQYQSWLECEAATLAKLQGRYTEEPTEALIVGNYVHTYFEGEQAHREFLAQNADAIFKTKTVKGETVITGKYAAYEKADAMIHALENYPAAKAFIDKPGENEVIFTGELFGMPWRIRVDKYIPLMNTIVDYKTVADLHKTEYDPEYGAKVPFLITYGYFMRAAVYTEIYKQSQGTDIDPHFLLLCVTKQDPPDKEVFRLNDRDVYDIELEKVKKHIPRIKRIKEGSIKPLRCETCAYCRATKNRGVVPYSFIMPGFSEREEDDYLANFHLDKAENNEQRTSVQEA